MKRMLIIVGIASLLLSSCVEKSNNGAISSETNSVVVEFIDEDAVRLFASALKAEKSDMIEDCIELGIDLNIGERNGSVVFQYTYLDENVEFSAELQDSIKKSLSEHEEAIYKEVGESKKIILHLKSFIYEYYTFNDTLIYKKEFLPQ